MQTLFQTRSYLEKIDTDISDTPFRERNRKPKFFLFFLAMLVVGTAIFMANEDFLVERDGKTDLAPWRKAKLMKELEDMEEGEQYVLKVIIPGFYPCYSCVNSNKMFLNTGEVWKYGVVQKLKEVDTKDAYLLKVFSITFSLKDYYRIVTNGKKFRFIIMPYCPRI